MDLSQLVQDVIDGNESGLVALAVLKEEKALIDKYIKEVEPTALEEAESYGEKKFTHKDLEVERREGRRMFNFKVIPEWNSAKADLTAIEEKAKIAYSNYEKGAVMADKGSGEVIALPEVTYSKESLIIKRVEV